MARFVCALLLVLLAIPASAAAERRMLSAPVDALGAPALPSGTVDARHHKPGHGNGPPPCVPPAGPHANQPPTATPQSVSTPEDTATGITLSGSDPESGPLTFEVLTSPSHGTLTGTPPNLTYTPDTDYTGADAFTFRVTDDCDRTATATVSIDVGGANDPPVVTTSSGSAEFTEGGGPVAVDPALTVTDGDSPALAGATVQVTGGYDSGDDVLAFADTASISGTFTPATGTLALTGSASPADYQAALRAVTFSSTSTSAAPRTVSFQVDDGAAAGNLSAVATRDVTMTFVNSAPVLTTTSAALAYTEGDGAVAVDDAITVDDSDTANLSGATVAITANYANGEDVLAFADTASITGTFAPATGVLTLTGPASVADYQAALRAVTYENTSGDPSTATRTVSFRADDGEATNNLSNSATRDITVTAVNSAPVAGDDSFSSALGNTRLAVGTTATGPHRAIDGDVLADDSDPDGPASALTVADGAIATTNGGTVAMEDDGEFLYDPPAGYSGDDTFDYTLEDNDPADPKTDTGTVTVTVVEPNVWYVDGDAAGPGSGRSHDPFSGAAPLTTGGSADALDGSGDVVFLYDAASDYTGGLALEAGQRLIGEPQGLTVGADALVPAGGSNPAIGNGAGHGIALADGVEIKRVDVANTSGAGIFGSAVTTADVGPDTAISGAAGPAFQLTGAAGGDVTMRAAIANTAGRSVSIEDRSSGTVALPSAVNDTGAGILLDDNAGASVDFDGLLTVSSAASDAFSATDGGTVEVSNAASTLATTTGTALRVAGTTIAGGGVHLRSISANGAPNGIVLDGTGSSGGLTVHGTGAPASGGTIADTTGNAVSLNQTDDVSLTNLRIEGADRKGVLGRDVSGFTYADGAVVGAGDAKVDPKDAAFAFGTDGAGTENNVDGALSITGTTIANPYGAGIDVHQYAGTLTNATITGNALTSSASGADSKDDGIAIHLDGSASSAASLLQATISNNSIAGFPNGFGIFLAGGNVGGAGAPGGTIGTPGGPAVTVSGNLIAGDATTNLNGAPIHARVLGKGQGRYAITNNGTPANPLTNSKDNAIELGADGAVDAEFDVTGNVVDASDAVFGGGAITFGAGEWTVAGPTTLSNPAADVNIAGNTVQASVGPGVDTIVRDSAADVDLAIQGNTLASPSQENTPGVQVASGSAGSGTAPALCATIAGNTAGRGAPDAFGDAVPGIAVIKRFAAGSSFGITGLAPSPATGAQTESYLSGQNPASALGAGFWAGKRAGVLAGTGFTACTA